MTLLLTLQRLLKANVPQTPTKRPPTFSGFDDEDPEEFLRNIEEYLRDKAHPDDFVEATTEQLRHHAANWFAAIKYRLDWEEFKTLLVQRYASLDTIAELQMKLYSQAQSPEETTTNFLKRKEHLARRLGQTDEKVLATIFRKLLLPEIQLSLPFPLPTTFHDLCTMAALVEKRQEEKRRWKATEEHQVVAVCLQEQPTQTVVNSVKATPSQKRPSLPRCIFCPERHWKGT